MSEFEDVINRLQSLANAEKVILKKNKFGIVSKNSLGIYHKDLKLIAKEIGQNNELALALFESGIYEARILCSKMFKPANITEALMESWVKTFENWEICDSFCMGLFAKSAFAQIKILEWTSRKNEFEKRAGFATLAAYCMAGKTVKNSVFENFIPIIEREATDDRQYVKKAVNWSLRNIGKRNKDLNHLAINAANRINNIDSKSAKWIASNALKELENPKANILDYPRHLYRK